MLKTIAGDVGRKSVRAGVAAAAMMLLVNSGAAEAQVAVTGGVDVPSLYYFRGVRQEVDPKLTLQPFIDVGGSLMSDGQGTLKSATLNVGSFNSIHTGSNKDDFGAFYESDVYATLGLSFDKFSLGTTYTAYTYPAPGFDTIHEIAFKGSFSNKLAPYGLVAFEFAEDNPGTYVELGVGPSFPLTSSEGGPTLTIPVRIAFDAKDYYGGDTGFSYFGIGGTVVIPRGKWSIKLAVDSMALSDTLKAYNTKEDGSSSKMTFVGTAGLGFSF